MAPKNVILHFPYRGPAAGVNVLFLRLANAIAEDASPEVFLGDYEDGYMVSQKRHPKVRTLIVKPGEPARVPEDAAIVFQTLPPWYISSELVIPPSTTILFWNLHPYNLLMYFKDDGRRQPAYYQLGRKYVQNRMREFTRAILDRRGLIFMDGENRRSAEAVLGQLLPESEFVPVAVGETERLRFTPSTHYAWLGRLSDFKVPILIHVLRTLSRHAYKHSHRLTFHVFGDGELREEVLKAVRETSHAYFEIIMEGDLKAEAIPSRLGQACCLLFAMGTSALEGARLGLPTIILDFSYEAVPENHRFRFLYEAVDYNLTQEIQSDSAGDGLHNVEEIVRLMGDPDQYEEVSNRTYAYYLANHEINQTKIRLLKAIDRSKLRYRDIRRFRNDPVMKVFRTITRSKQQ
jgi:hypothetical protein